MAANRRSGASFGERPKGNKKSRTQFYLIATEDTDSSYFYFNYFKMLMNQLHIDEEFASIIDIEKTGKDPSGLIKDVYELIENRRNEKVSDYDKIFCVFDRDDHYHFENSIIEIENENWFAIYSIPCFEVWVLLHYYEIEARYKPVYATPPIIGGKNPSYCGYLQKTAVFKQYIPNYAKNNADFFKQLISLLETAKVNARKLEEFNTIHAVNFKPSDSPYPRTKIHELVEQLELLKS